MGTRPNIVYIHTHDSGRYIGPYGHNLPTPHLQAMAANGTIFRQCFNAGPTCSPSRAALLTGQYPHQNGMIGLAHRGFSLNDPSKHLAAYLTANGYETALCGVQHVASYKNRETLGYTRLLDQDPVDQDVARARLEAMGLEPHQVSGRMHITNDRAKVPAVTRFLREKKDKPFFLSFGMVCTHRAFANRDPDIDPNRMQPPPQLPDNARTREDMAEYATMVRCVDDCVGGVLRTLDETGLADNTFVFFTTDHGIAFPRMKCHLHDQGIGVALLVKYPNNPSAGKAIDALVSHVDLYPTLCDIAGIDKPEWLEGSSLKPLLEGSTDSVRDEVFSEVTYHAAYEPMRCVRTERYKYIRYFDDTMDLVVKPNIDDGYSKQFLMDHGLMEREHDPREMLFDLYYDPQEYNNLAGSESHAAVRDDMAKRLEQWMKDTDDPLLDGPVAPPEGARVNNRRGVHANETDWE